MRLTTQFYFMIYDINLHQKFTCNRSSVYDGTLVVFYFNFMTAFNFPSRPKIQQQLIVNDHTLEIILATVLPSSDRTVCCYPFGSITIKYLMMLIVHNSDDNDDDDKIVMIKCNLCS